MKDEVCQYLYSGNFDTSFPLKADTKKHAFICVKTKSETAYRIPTNSI